jgi:PAS domain S-box-containing protein
VPDERLAAVPVGSELTDDAMRSALDAAPDGVVVDEAGTIVFVNPMVEQLFGYAREELLGESVDRLLPTDVQMTHAAHRAAYVERPRARAMGSGLNLRGRQRSGAGNGLVNMRRRAEGLGGRSEVSERASGGTTVEWRVPIAD